MRGKSSLTLKHCSKYISCLVLKCTDIQFQAQKQSINKQYTIINSPYRPTVCPFRAQYSLICNMLRVHILISHSFVYSQLKNLNQRTEKQLYIVVDLSINHFPIRSLPLSSVDQTIHFVNYNQLPICFYFIHITRIQPRYP